ncbi:hypothetical protein PPERSA_05191 [Pseudocohnilembus persalinus]|uniref:EH domain-containing protein n=1 Tax=Pseudocohnilembus persalinus TaxID=266149 RepID=A0A0V0R9V9_PSEPJ|nr:hypothetical protein PPERSA_05191 [Pseudocohnilembus persalinus]|eukprot:KRX11082.1 hypothetical protein PPERSA_05191 [Pseudocohnilembus persalinus]
MDQWNNFNQSQQFSQNQYNNQNQQFSNNQMMANNFNQPQMQQFQPQSQPLQQQQQMATPPKIRLSINLQNNERGFYSALLQQADKNDSQKVYGKEAVEFFMRSGVSKEILRQIWDIASYNGEYLDRDEFYVALRLIAYAQNGISVNAQSIQNNIPVALPKFGPKQQSQSQNQSLNQSYHSSQSHEQPPQNAEKKPSTVEELTRNMLDDYNKTKAPAQQVHMDQNSNLNNSQSQINMSQNSNQMQNGAVNQIKDDFALSEEMVAKYQQYFQMTDTQKTGKISGAQAKPIFSKSKLDKETLGKIWSWSDQNNTGELNQDQFIVALHLIYMKGKGHELPNTLPQSLQQFLNRNTQQPGSQNYSAFDNLQSGTQSNQNKQANSNTNSETSNQHFNFSHQQNNLPQMQNNISQHDKQQFNQQNQEMSEKINQAKSQLQAHTHEAQDKILYVKELHSIIISEKKDELDYVNKLIQAQENLCKLIEEENESLKKEMAGLEELKGNALQQLANLGQRMWVGVNEQQTLKKQLVSTASNAINEISNASSQAIQRGGSNSQQGGKEGNQSNLNNSNTQQKQGHEWGFGEGGFGNTQNNDQNNSQTQNNNNNAFGEW